MPNALPQWIFATNNAHKLEEVRAMLSDFAQILSLNEVHVNQDIPETADTFEGNALIKAQTIFELTGLPCFADDSGLCVSALNGAPGVKSARYANDHGPVDHQANNVKLLKALENQSNREAFFISVICLAGLTPEPIFFEGRVQGTIAGELAGHDGFGYDPLFIPEGYNQTFAELGSEIKNQFSHRANAIAKLRTYLSSQTV